MTLFFLPLAARVVYWVGINRVQSSIFESVVHTKSPLLTLIHQEHPLTPVFESIVEDMNSLTPCLASVCTEKRIWEILLLAEHESKIWMLTTLSLLLYNIARIFLAWQVSALREEEDRSGISPKYRGRDGYQWLHVTHLAVRWIVFVAAAAFVYHAANWLNRPIWLPATP
jgi:hypothetical protein